MNLLADENIDHSLVERLRIEGHDVLYTAEMEPGVDDAVVLARANERNAILVTDDKDFGELVYRQRLVHAGVLLVRLAGLRATKKGDLVAAALANHGDELIGAFAVVSPGALRIRRPTQ